MATAEEGGPPTGAPAADPVVPPASQQQPVSRARKSVEELLAEDDAEEEDSSPVTARQKLEELLREDDSSEDDRYVVVGKDEPHPRGHPRAVAVETAALVKNRGAMAVSALKRQINSLRSSSADIEGGELRSLSSLEEEEEKEAEEKTSPPAEAVTAEEQPKQQQQQQQRKVVVKRKSFVIKQKKKPAAAKPQPQSRSTASSRTDEEIAELEKKLELLKAHSGLNDDELEWKLAATSTDDPYGMAVSKRESCEAEYDRLMWHQSKLEALIRLCDDRRVTDALKALAKVCRAPPPAPPPPPEPTTDKAPTKDDDGQQPKPPPVPEAEKKEAADDAPPVGKKAFAGALGAALANRGRGGPFGGRGAGGPMGGRGGGLMAAISARGRGGRGGAPVKSFLAAPKKKTVASARSSLETARQRSRQETSRLPVADLEEFKIVERLVADVLDVPEDEKEKMAEKCDDAVSMLSETIEDSKSELEEVSKALLESEDDLERWRKREADAPNRAAALAKSEREWAARESFENAVALAITRTLVPPDVAAETAESLRLRAAKRIADAVDKAKGSEEDSAAEASSSSASSSKARKRSFLLAAKWGGIYTFELAQRIKACKPLHWVQAHPADLTTANFLVGAGADTFKNLSDYDVVELRAIYASCPDKFELDASGAKAAWRAALVEKLREMTSRQRGETISAGWDGVNDRRKEVRLPPLLPKQRRNAAYFYPSKSELEARSAKYEQARERLEIRKVKVADLERQLGEAKAERDAAFVDARSEYLQQRYGKPMLKDLAREADEQYRKIVADLGTETSATGARADLRRAESAVANATPSEAEHASLRKLLEKFELDAPDAQKDSSDLANLRKRVADKLSTADENALEAVEDDRGQGDEAPLVGRLIRGPFDPWPEIKRAEKAAVVKKLSDAEEAELRKKELIAATRAPPGEKSARRAFDAPSQSASRPSLATKARSTPSAAAGKAPGASPDNAPSPKHLEPVQPKSRRLSALLAKQQKEQQEQQEKEAEASTATVTTQPAETAVHDDKEDDDDANDGF